MKRRWPELVVAVLTVLSIVAMVRGLRLSPDVSSLLPRGGDGAALQQYARAFGGGDLAMLLVSGADPAKVSAATHAATEALARCDRVHAALDGFPAPEVGDPTQAWAVASPQAMRRLEEALTPGGMRERLQETRALLLGPGAGALAETIRRDPLRLSQIPFERGTRVAEGAAAEDGGVLGGGGSLVADEGRARLVLIAVRGDALRGSEARGFVQAAGASLAAVRAAHPDVRFELTGGHAIAAATEAMIRRDLTVSGTASLVLAAVAFALVFRRVRALIAVLPPLLVGTVWTAALAGTLFDHVSGIAVAFVSVVVGVGMDTGVHVYSALIAARARGLGPQEAADTARREMVRPTLTAAVAAAAAFGSLGLSEIEALRQLGLLCAAGEVLTAAAILVVTPRIGAWLERGAQPSEASEPNAGGLIGWLWRGRIGMIVAGVAVAAPTVVIATSGMPGIASALVGVRPSKLEPIRVQDRVFELFGGTHGQWVVMVSDDDPGTARARLDTIADRLSSSGDLEGQVSSLSWMAPARATQARRLRQRDALGLPGKVEELREALGATGFDPERFEPAYAALRTPSAIARDPLESGAAAALLRARFLAQDAGRAVAALYAVPKQGREHAVEELIASVDRGATLAGYARLDHALRSSLARDLPKIGAVAAGLVAIALLLSLRRMRDAAIALGAIAVELAWVLAVVKVAGLRLHAYNALVIPVLVGITVDEAMFLLARAQREGVQGALRSEWRNVTTTALTTAAGFGALVVCRFDGLADLGWVGAMGSVAGLVAALLVVPAGLRAGMGSRLKQGGDAGRCSA